MLTKKDVCLVFVFLIVAKTLIAFFVPVVGDESYYWYWGQNLQLSYFDHPPMVSWLTAASEALSFLPDWLRVRSSFILLSTFSVFVWLKVFQRSYQPTRQTSLLFLLFFNLNPLLGMGGIFATPDVPLIFFWGCSFYFVLRTLQTQKWHDYLLLGIFLGLGFCAKYHIVLFVPTILLYIAVSNQLKKINLKYLGFTFVGGFVFSLPVIIWNYQNSWESFLFQLNHGFTRSQYNWEWSASYLMGQILLFSPFLIYSLVRALKKSELRTMALAQWAFFFYSSTKAPVEANWPIAAQAQGVAALDFKYLNLKLSLAYWVFIYLFLIIFVCSSFGQEKIRNVPNATEIRRILPDILNYQPLYGPSYQISSLIHYLSGREVKKLPRLGRYDFYDRLQEIPTPVKGDKFYLLKHANSWWPEWTEKYKKTDIKKFKEYNLELILLENE